MKTDTNPVLVAHPTNIITSNRLFRISIYSNSNEFTVYSELPDDGIELRKIDNRKIKKLIDKYKDVLINSIDDVSIAKAEPHTIELTNENPIKLRPYKISL